MRSSEDCNRQRRLKEEWRTWMNRISRCRLQGGRKGTEQVARLRTTQFSLSLSTFLYTSASSMILGSLARFKPTLRSSIRRPTHLVQKRKMTTATKVCSFPSHPFRLFSLPNYSHIKFRRIAMRFTLRIDDWRATSGFEISDYQFHFGSFLLTQRVAMCFFRLRLAWNPPYCLRWS